MLYEVITRFVAEFIGETNLFRATTRKGGEALLPITLHGLGTTCARSACPLPSDESGFLSIRPEKLAILNGNAGAPDVCTLRGRLENVLHQGDTIKYFIRPGNVETENSDGLVVMKMHNRSDTPRNNFV